MMSVPRSYCFSEKLIKLVPLTLFEIIVVIFFYFHLLFALFISAIRRILAQLADY